MNNDLIEFQKALEQEDSDQLTEAQKRVLRLRQLAQRLESEKQEYINARKETGVEARLIAAARLYTGATDTAGKPALDENVTTPEVGSRVYQNITRQITNDGASQLGDMLFPADDSNWDIEALPIAPPPLLLRDVQAIDRNNQPRVNQDGSPVTNMEVFIAYSNAAKEKTSRMRKKIDASLVIAKYPAKGRKCIFDSALYGTGILKGPVVGKVSPAQWKKRKGTYRLVDEKKYEPDLRTVNPLDFFPDMSCTNIEDSRAIYERSYLTPSQLRKLRKNSAYIASEIQELLKEGTQPYNSYQDDTKQEARDASSHSTLSGTGRFEVWERWGEISKTDLIAAGEEFSEKDTNTVYFGCVVFCQGRVLKAHISHSDRFEFIYSLFNWDEDPLSVFGYGIPTLMQDCQHTYNTAWRMALDNAGVSTMPQVVVDKTMIKPADGSNDYRIRAGKVWEKTGNQYSRESSTAPFELFHIQQDIQQLFNLMDKATNDAYELTGVTRVQKNQAGVDNAPVTLGATQIFQNNSSVSRRAQVRRYDDEITLTLLTRFYDFFMQYDPDEDAKFTMRIEPRGSSVLLVKELQATNLMQFFQMTQGGQVEGVKQLPLLRTLATTMQFPEGRFVETEIETQQRQAAEAQQPPQEDPALMIEMERLEIDKAKVELEQAKLQIAHAKAQMDAQLEALRLEDGKQARAEKAMADMQKHYDKIQADLQKVNLTEKTKRDIKAAEVNQKQLADMQAGSLKAREVAARETDVAIKAKELTNKINTGQEGI